MESSWILGVETSTHEGSLAVKSMDHSKVFELSWSRENSHSEVITEKAKQLFTQAGIKPDDLAGIACGCGPGSFTGIRVAMNFAKAMAYSYGLKVWTVNTLRTLAQNNTAQNVDILCATDAFRDLVYCSEFHCDSNGLVSETQAPFATTINQLISLIDKPFVAIGSTFDSYWEELSPVHHHLTKVPSASPSARLLIEASQSVDQVTQTCDWKTAKPLYIRASEAEEKLKSGELKPQKIRK